MKRFLLAVVLTAVAALMFAEQAQGQGYYGRFGYPGVYGPAYYNTYRPYYPGYAPYQAYNPAYNYYGPYPRHIAPNPRYYGPSYYVPYRAWGAAPGGFYGGGNFYLY